MELVQDCRRGDNLEEDGGVGKNALTDLPPAGLRITLSLPVRAAAFIGRRPASRWQVMCDGWAYLVALGPGDKVVFWAKALGLFGRAPE